MRHYDLTLLINPALETTKANELWQGFLAQFQQQGAIFDKTWQPSLIDLAYPIKKQLRAYLVGLTFYLKPEKVASLEQLIKKQDDFLRHLVFEKKVVSPRPSRRTAVRRTAVEKLSPEELDRKLEEILGK